MNTNPIFLQSILNDFVGREELIDVEYDRETMLYH